MLLKLSSYALLADMKRSASHGTEAHAEIAILSAIDYRLHRSGTLGSSIDSRGFRNRNIMKHLLILQGRFFQPRRSKECITVQLQHYISENAETVSVNLHYGHCSLSQLIPLNRQAYHPLIEVLNSNLHRTPRNKVLFVFRIPL